MAIQLFNHNQGKNGSHWVNLMRNGKADQILVGAIDIGKYTHKTLMTNVYQDVLAPASVGTLRYCYYLERAQVEHTFIAPITKEKTFFCALASLNLEFGSYLRGKFQI